ncbi:MAG TPA: N-acetylglucosamine-6-phosphate deacetylase [Melioribacteraceae bacterium]|nr:N-acetylglucosamine-6-phosphate deacetylase [Melioribacteraceae bacterium]
MENSVLIKNCKPYFNRNSKINLLISDGKIIEVGEINDNKYDLIDGRGLIISPGLIDIHIQGAGGVDILDNDEDKLLLMCKTLAKLGTTGFLATTVVKNNINNMHLKKVNNLYNKQLDGATILGTHLEGPFINLSKKGGIDEKSIYPFDGYNLNEIIDAAGNSLKMMTLAPELDKSDVLIKLLQQNNIIPSLGHTEADYNTTIKCFEYGLNHVTHLCNAMNSIKHREPGPIPAIVNNGNITCQIISDGHHINKGMIKFLYNILGIKNIILITDGIQAMGLPDGKYVYNGREYHSNEGAAKYNDGTLIGSSFPLIKIVEKFIEFTGCTLQEGINAASYNPAKLLGLSDTKGSLDIGKDADLILFDDNLNVKFTIINGKIIK